LIASVGDAVADVERVDETLVVVFVEETDELESLVVEELRVDDLLVESVELLVVEDKLEDIFVVELVLLVVYECLANRSRANCMGEQDLRMILLWSLMLCSLFYSWN
jgi:hypothetical protein